MEIFEQVLTFLKPLIEAYGGNFGVAVQVVAVVGTLRLFFKPIVAAVESAVKESSSTKDDELLATVQGNSIYKGFIFLLDLIASIKLKPKSDSSK
jgi:hypothetical protein